MIVQDERIIKINDCDIYFRVCGNGPALQLLHGFFFSSAMWDPFIDQLGADFQLILPDARGHGRSTNPSKTFTHRQAASDFYALLDELGIESFNAAGHRSGSMSLLNMATLQPNRIDSMVLFSSTYTFPDATCELMEAMTMEGRRWVPGIYPDAASRG
jgi:pimeloyl-ACP methyl ester carboxylesterase